MSSQSNDAQGLAHQATLLVREWLTTAQEINPSVPAKLLAGVLDEPGGLEFTVGFVDGVVRPEDPQIAARNLRDLARNTPRFLPWYLRAGVRLGATASHVAPGIVVRVAQRTLRALVGHLIVDADAQSLGKSLAAIKSHGRKLNVNLLGEAVLGPREAEKRLAGTRRLLERDDVDYVSIKVSSTVAPHSPWAFDQAVSRLVEQLLPLYLYAASQREPKFINLDMEEYKDLELTLAVFMRVMDHPQLRAMQAGIVLQAYLPDAMDAMIRLQQWASVRRAGGGAPIKVRLVKGANLPMERVEAALHGWPLATVGSKLEADVNYKRVLNFALTQQRTDAVKVGIAGHNLFDIAYSWLLAGQRGVRDAIEYEMLLGMAEAQAEAVSRTVGELLLYTPVVPASEFNAAIAYLTRRLEEGAAHENFMSAVFQLGHDEQLFEREQQRFLDAVARVDDVVPAPNRTQDRRVGGELAFGAGYERAVEGAGRGREMFANVPDTDPALAGNREWGSAIVARMATSQLGMDLVKAHSFSHVEQAAGVVAMAHDAQPQWAAIPGVERARVLRRIAREFEARRVALMEVAGSECGKTLDQSDPEISEAIDFANYYAHLAEQLDHISGAQPVPVRVTLVAPPWNFPVAIPAGSTLAALAAGSAVVVKPAPQAQRCGSMMVQAVWAALDACGNTRDIVQLAHSGEGDAGRALIADPRIDRLILTGAYDTAELFMGFNPNVQLLAETSGKNAIVVTPSADFDLAVRDIVTSAFGHGGQKCSAASLVILVGSAGTSYRLRNQLLDAVSGLRVGYPSDVSAQMGPLVEPASGKLLKALTQLDEGERWAITPQQLDETGMLWSPGVKTGVQPGSEFHLTEYFGPVLGIMTVETLDEAIAAQNATQFGLTAGLHSLDPMEIARWRDGVHAGNLYINRGITGAIVRRQPFGGWKRSAVGAGAKAGGPNYLFGLVDWIDQDSNSVDGGRSGGTHALDESTAFPQGSIEGRPSSLSDDVARFVGFVRNAAGELGMTATDVEYVALAALGDEWVWATEFGVVRDVSGLVVERNEFRYVPADVVVRVEGNARVADAVRVLAAAVRASGELGAVEVSLSSEFADSSARAALVDLCGGASLRVGVHSPSEWVECVGARRDIRIRLIGGSRRELVNAIGVRADVAVYAQPVTRSGRVEGLVFVREQAISATNHRFGSVLAWNHNQEVGNA